MCVKMCCNQWKFDDQPQQNYLAKTDMDSSVFFCDNPIFMSVQVVMIPLGITTTWKDIKTCFLQKYMELSKSILAR